MKTNKESQPNKLSKFAASKLKSAAELFQNTLIGGIASQKTSEPQASDSDTIARHEREELTTTQTAHTTPSYRRNPSMRRATFYYFKHQLIALKKLRQSILETEGKEVDISSFVREAVDLYLRNTLAE